MTWYIQNNWDTMSCYEFNILPFKDFFNGLSCKQFTTFIFWVGGHFLNILAVSSRMNQIKKWNLQNINVTLTFILKLLFNGIQFLNVNATKRKFKKYFFTLTTAHSKFLSSFCWFSNLIALLVSFCIDYMMMLAINLILGSLYILTFL